MPSRTAFSPSWQTISWQLATVALSLAESGRDGWLITLEGKHSDFSPHPKLTSNRFTVLFLMTFGTSIITFGWIWMKTLPAMVAFVVIFGLFSGGLVPLGSACVAQTTPDMGHIGLRIGVMMAFCSLGALAGGPISGTIKDRFGEWVGVFGFSSSVTLVGAFMLLGVRVMWEPTMTRTF